MDNSGKLFDKIKVDFNLKNDNALSAHLGVYPPTISKIRNGTAPITPALILRVHTVCKLEVDHIVSLVNAYGTIYVDTLGKGLP